MTHEDHGHYANKHPKDRRLDPKIAEAVKRKVKDGKISCAAAFGVVRELGITPENAGFTIDSLEIKITHCQLGTFGYGADKKPIKPMDNVAGEIKKAIEGSLEKGRLPCKSAWEIADRFDVSKLEIGSACETMKIKVSSCQLGAF